MVQYNMPTFSMELPGSFSDFTGGDTLRAQELDYVIAGAGGDPMHRAIAEIYASTQSGGQGDQQRAMLIEELSRKSGRPVTQETINYVLAQMDKGRFQNEAAVEFDNSITSQEKADVSGAIASGAETEEEINAWLRKKETPTRIGLNDKDQIIEIPPSNSEEKKDKKITPSNRQPGLNIANDGDEEVITEDTLTLKDRMSSIFNDADKRDAILGGIADAMLETRTGADAYGNRFNRAQKNVRDNLKIAEATDIARQKAQLDAMKTMAETNKLMDPRQYLTNAQREAESFVRAQIRAGKVKPEDFNTAYASMLKQIAVKDLTSAKASSIGTLFTYAQALQQSDPDTAKILMDAIRSNANYLAGDSSGEASGEVVIDATEFKK